MCFAYLHQMCQCFLGFISCYMGRSISESNIYLYGCVNLLVPVCAVYLCMFLLYRLEDHREVNQIFLDLLPDMEKISTFQERLVSKMPTTQPLENL